MNNTWRTLLAAAALAVGTLAGLAPAHAASLFVTDKILLGIHQAPSEDSAILKSVSSGTELQVLQTEGNFTQVKAPDGTEGWVASSYLMSQKPAQVVLQQMRSQADKDRKDLAALRDQLQVKHNELKEQQAKVDALKKQLAAAKTGSADAKALADAQAQVKALQDKLADVKQQEKVQAKELATPSQEEIKKVHDQNMELQARIELALASLNGKKLPPADELAAVRPKFPPWYLGLLAAVALVGFIGGVLFLDRRYRKRHGGFRV